MEWKTGLPEKSGDYVVLTKYSAIVTIHYSAKYKIFNSYDSDTKKRAQMNSLNDHILKWVPLEDFLKEQGLSNEESN